MDRPLTSTEDEGDLRHPAASEMSMSQKAVVVDVAADAVIDLATAVVPFPLDDPAHPFGAGVVLRLKAVQGARHDAVADHHHLTVPDPRFVVLAARLPGLLRVAIEPGAATGHSRQAMIAEGCAGLALGLRHQ